MKFIKRLVGKKEETPTWDIKPPSRRPAPRAKSASDEPPVIPQKKEKDPFLDDDFVNTMTFEADAIPLDNPYETPNWEDDLENDTRKLKTIQIGEKPEESPEDKCNPYASGSFKRSWKK
jgi:hypothetical protein